MEIRKLSSSLPFPSFAGPAPRLQDSRELTEGECLLVSSMSAPVFLCAWAVVGRNAQLPAKALPGIIVTAYNELLLFNTAEHMPDPFASLFQQGQEPSPLATSIFLGD